MQPDELDVLIDKTATLMVQYERRSAGIEERLEALGEALQGLTLQLPGVVKRSAEGLLHTLPGELAGVAKAKLDRPLADCRAGLHAAGDELANATRTLAGQIEGLQNLHRLLLWKAIAAVTVALALLLGGGAWLSLHYSRIIRDNQVAAELMQAYNRADVVVCGKGELCANVDAKHARYGDRGQYLKVKPR